MECNLQLLKIELFESIKQKQLSSLPAIADRSIELLELYSNDKYVLSTIDLIMESLRQIDSDAGAMLMREISARATQLDSASSQPLFQSLDDRIKIIETKYGQLFENRWSNGDAGRQDLIETTMDLATDPQGGRYILKTVAAVMNWLEQNGHCEQCQPIYQAMLESAGNRTDQKIQTLARKMGENGIKRCNLSGSKLQLNGRLFSGDLLDPDDYRNRVVILLFWSAKSAGAIERIKNIRAEFAGLLSHGVSALAICTEDQFEDTAAIGNHHISHFQFVTKLSGNPTENSLMDQCGIEQVPHAIILDRDGIVVEANLPLDELVKKAEYHARQKAKQRPENPAIENE